MKKTKTNDIKILQLRKKIEDKQKALFKIDKFVPSTTCILKIDGETKNIHVMNRSELQYYYVKLKSYKNIADEDFDGDFEMCGFPISSWIDDISNKLAIMDQKNTEKQLIDMNHKLNNLLSEEKRTELELEEIDNLLK